VPAVKGRGVKVQWARRMVEVTQMMVKKSEVDGSYDCKDTFLHSFFTTGSHINDTMRETSAEKARELDVHSGLDFTTDV